MLDRRLVIAGTGSGVGKTTLDDRAYVSFTEKGIHRSRI